MKVYAKLVRKYFFSNIILQYLLTAASIFAIDSTWSSIGDNNDPVMDFSTRFERSSDSDLTKINFRDNCTCGIRPPEPVKIVGGVLANESFWPWAVPLVYTKDPSKPVQFCGASLINTQYLLTAAHCAEEMVKQGVHNYQAFLGTNAISNPSAIKLNISQVKMHPNYDSKTLANDIALLKLNQPVVFSARVHPVCLKQAQSPYVGYIGVVVGWGSLQSGGPGVDQLREVKVEVISNVYCAQNYSAANIVITGQMMCASMPGKDSCQGDSGGPLVIWNPRSKIFCQMGIVSFGLNCGSPYYPGVYTRAFSFIKWIQSNTQDASYCRKSF